MLTELMILRYALLAYKAIHEIRELRKGASKRAELTYEVTRQLSKQELAFRATGKMASLGNCLATLAEHALDSAVW